MPTLAEILRNVAEKVFIATPFVGFSYRWHTVQCTSEAEYHQLCKLVALQGGDPTGLFVGMKPVSPVDESMYLLFLAEAAESGDLILKG